MNIAESILHYKFRENHYTKEFFEFDLENTKIKAEKILDDFFRDELIKERIKLAKTKAKEITKKLNEIKRNRIDGKHLNK